MAFFLPLSLQVVMAAIDCHQLDTLGISVRCTQRFARRIKLPLVPTCTITRSRIRVRYILASKTHILYMCVHPSNKHRWPGVALGCSVVVTSTGLALTERCPTQARGSACGRRLSGLSGSGCDRPYRGSRPADGGLQHRAAVAVGCGPGPEEVTRGFLHRAEAPHCEAVTSPWPPQGGVLSLLRVHGAPMWW